MEMQIEATPLPIKGVALEAPYFIFLKNIRSHYILSLVAVQSYTLGFFLDECLR